MSEIDKAHLQLTKCVKCVGCSRLDDEDFRGDERCMQFIDSTPKDLNKLKQQYNVELSRMKKAEAFMDGPASQEKKEKWQSEFQRQRKRMGELIADIRVAGHEMSSTEILEGFHGQTET
jgi:hypothetical protein